MSQQTAYRTHHATDVTEGLVGEHVTLAGWVDRRRDHGGVAFIDLRDNTGLVQVVINDEEMAHPLRSEYVIEVDGKVRLRPEGNENDHLATGKVEVVAEKIRVLAKSDALPLRCPPHSKTNPRTSCRARMCVSSTATSICDVRPCSATSSCVPT